MEKVVVHREIEYRDPQHLVDEMIALKQQLNAALANEALATQTLTVGESASLDFELANIEMGALSVRLIDEQGALLPYPVYVWAEQSGSKQTATDKFAVELETATGEAVFEVPQSGSYKVGAPSALLIL